MTDGRARPVSIHNGHGRLRFRRTEVVRMIHALDAGAAAMRIAPSRIPRGELSVVFLTDGALAKLHADFLDDPTTTDVITFEGDPAAGTAGEICVSVDTAARYAADTSRDFAGELALYLVHGWLHLAGFDDLEPAKKRRMRAAEKRAMNLLGATGAVPSFKISGARRR